MAVDPEAKRRMLRLARKIDTETGEIVWAVGDDQICAVTRADFIRTPEIRYNDVLIQEFPYKENTPESVGRWRPLIEELVKLTLAKYRTLDGLARAYLSGSQRKRFCRSPGRLLRAPSTIISTTMGLRDDSACGQFQGKHRPAHRR